MEPEAAPHAKVPKVAGNRARDQTLTTGTTPDP